MCTSGSCEQSESGGQRLVAYTTIVKPGLPRRRLPDTRAFLAPAIANIFEELHLSAALREGGPWRTSAGGWRAIHVEDRNLSSFEIEHGVEAARAKYDLRCMNRAHRLGTIVRGEHAGLSDLFVPVMVGGHSVAVLATGPFATARSTSADVLTRWHWLTRRRGHPSDPEFAHYLSTTLSTLVLEGRKIRDFERFLLCFAKLLSGEGHAKEALAQADVLRRNLNEARSAERAWEAARSMVDERTQRSWSSSDRILSLRELGLSRAPDHVLVGLIASRQPELEEVDERRLQHGRRSHRLQSRGVDAPLHTWSGRPHLGNPRRR